jgi:hypothetical protein
MLAVDGQLNRATRNNTSALTVSVEPQFPARIST